MKEYAEFGQSHTQEQREAAALAAIAILYGTTWTNMNTGSSLDMASQRLIDFATEDTFHDICDREHLLDLPDEKQPVLVERGMAALRSAFDWQNAPHSPSTWRKVQTYARSGAR